MSKDLTKENAFIFRILHVDNVPAVLENGCHCRSTTVGKTYVEIGNQELIDKRTNRPVPCGPGGTLADYVPFYFTPYTPMMYNIKTGYGVKQQPLANIVIVVSSLHQLVRLNVPFVFSDRHAYLKAARFSSDLNDLSWIIWSVLQQRDFKKDDADKFEKYQAEALVYKHFPISAIVAVLCHDNSVRDSVRQMVVARGAGVTVETNRKWYL